MWNFWEKDPPHILSGSWAFSRGWAVAEVFSWYLNMSRAGARVIGVWHLRLQQEDRISVSEQSTRPRGIDISANQEESVCRSLNTRFSLIVMNFHGLFWIALSIFFLSFGPFPIFLSDFQIISHKFSWEGSHWRSHSYASSQFPIPYMSKMVFDKFSLWIWSLKKGRFTFK